VNVFTTPGRFLNLGPGSQLIHHTNKRKRGKPKKPKPPWVIPKEDIASLESIIPLLKTPSAWPPVRRFFSDLGFMKTSETLLFAGDAGAYFLRHMDIDPKYRDLFMRLLRVTQRCTHTHNNNTHTVSEKDAIP
jgi:hypothetical protein